MKITSTAFSESEMIPKEYTCDGQDISPPLAWTGVPAGTKSVALIADDPDAPVGTWVHWVAFDIPPDVTELPEAVPTGETLPTGGTHGNNNWRRLGYGGPCPPGGTHRYFFKLYALDILQEGIGIPDKKYLEAAMKGHILAKTVLVGTYRKSRSSLR